MTHALADAAPGAAPYRLAPHFTARATNLIEAARRLLPFLEAGRRIESGALREVMNAACGGSDAEGAWDWKSAYDACEAAQVLFFQKYGAAITARAAPSALALVERVAALLPTHTRRSEAGQALQQFSTPAGLAFVASVGRVSAPPEVNGVRAPYA